MTDPMLAQVRGAAGQVALALSSRFPPRRARPGPRRGARPERVLVIGTGGGSAMAGEALRRLADHRAQGLGSRAQGLGRQGGCPVDVCQDYVPPAWVGPRTLVLAASHSGDTQETLAALGRCAARRAAVVAFTAGGRLGALAAKRGWPVCPLTAGVMPRALFYEILASMVRLLGGWGLYPGADAELDAARRALERGVERRERAGRALASAIAGRLAWIAGAEPATAVCAVRLRNQLAENAKVLSVATALPRAHHDEIVGWGQDPALSRRFVAVLLRDRREDRSTLARFAATRALLRGRAARVIELRAEPGPLAARILTLCQTLDFATVHLAAARGVAATPVPVIDELKRKMGQR